ncbi:MAG: glycerol-3-phosphate 1-O-acyltransferase PlsY [Lachnospiraceae bacterium]|nr:glycerol-3-phosphate 1-O-acyltransferase PlsY [Lachnospiraceae bacterium]
MGRLICLVIGYVCGLFQTAYIYGKSKGIDIREKGSGNAGTTNTLRVFGAKAGLIVLLGDVLKCAVACLIARYFIVPMFPDEKYLLILYAAAGAILGHDFPFYMNFKGGKGIAATAGLICCLHWHFFVVGVIVFFTTFFVTHYVSLGSLLVYAAFMAQIIIEGQRGLFGATQVQLNEMYVIAFVLAVIAYGKHWENIKRLLKGEERKTYLSKKKKEQK